MQKALLLFCTLWLCYGSLDAQRRFTVNRVAVLDSLPEKQLAIVEKYGIGKELDKIPVYFRITRVGEAVRRPDKADGIAGKNTKRERIPSIGLILKDSLDSKIRKVSLRNFNQDNNIQVGLQINSANTFLNIQFLNCTFSQLSVRNSKIGALNIKQCQIRSTSVRKCKISHLRISNIQGQRFSVHDSEINSFRIDSFALKFPLKIEKNTIGPAAFHFRLDDSTHTLANFRENTFTARHVRFKGNMHASYPFLRKFVGNKFQGEVQFEAVRKPDDEDEIYILRDVEFEDNVYFRGQLPARLSLDYISTKKEIDFTWVDLDAFCKIALNFSEIEKVKLDYNNFLLSIFLPSNIPIDVKKLDDLRYQRREIDRKEIIFKKLLVKQKQDNLGDSYEKLDLHYKRYKYFRYYTQGGFKPWNWIFYIFSKAWWNFGYDKQWVFLWTLLFLGIFTGINYRFFDLLIGEVYTIKKIEGLYKKLNPKKLKPRSFKMEKLKLVTHYTLFLFLGFKLDHENLSFTRFGWTFYVYFVYTLGLICIAYILNYVLFLQV